MVCYLARKKKPVTYHLFDGSDTACRMWSTGGMNHRKYELVESVESLFLCTLCETHTRKDGDKWKR